MNRSSQVLVVALVLVAMSCDREGAEELALPASAAVPVVEEEPVVVEEEEAPAEEEAEEVALPDDMPDDLPPEEALLFQILGGEVSMEEALTVEEGVVWVANTESGGSEDTVDEVPQALLFATGRSGRVLCGGELEFFWDALPLTLDLYLDAGREESPCEGSTCTYPSLGEYHGKAVFTFDETPRLHSAVFYADDGTLDQIMRDHFRTETYELRDRTLAGSCGFSATCREMIPEWSESTVLEADLNSNGRTDRVMEVADSCAAGDCRGVVYLSCGDGTYTVAAGVSYAGDVEVSEPNDRGFRDILTTTEGGEVLRYSYNGLVYLESDQ